MSDLKKETIQLVMEAARDMYMSEAKVLDQAIESLVAKGRRIEEMELRTAKADIGHRTELWIDGRCYIWLEWKQGEEPYTLRLTFGPVEVITSKPAYNGTAKL